MQEANKANEKRWETFHEKYGDKSDFWEGPTNTRKRLNQSPQALCLTCLMTLALWGDGWWWGRSTHTYKTSPKLATTGFRHLLALNIISLTFLQSKWELGKEVIKVKGALSQVSFKMSSLSSSLSLFLSLFLSWTYAQWPIPMPFPIFIFIQLPGASSIPSRASESNGQSTVSSIDVYLQHSKMVCTATIWECGKA